MSAKRVLFLYISASSGHQRAADALQEALHLLAPNVESIGIDSFTYAYPKIGRVIARTYLEMLRHTPALWDYLYDNPDVVAATKEFRDLLNVISAPRMKSLVQKYNPQALVCTQAVPCSVYAAEKRRGRLHIPLIAVVTDFAIHTYWVHKEVDLYCVASEDSRKDLIRHGINASRIVVTGIPISPHFLRHIPKDQARIQLRFETHRPTVLVMGGSQGLGPLMETLEELHRLPIQILVTTGLNRKLYRSLQKQYARDKRVKVYGYTRLIGQFMDAADLLITKPGGLTSSEALVKGLPMIITNPIPGQEERNTRFLLKQGTAERADTPREILESVQNLLGHPNRLRKMSERAKEIGTPYASMEISRWIFQLINAGGKGDALGAR